MWVLSLLSDFPNFAVMLVTIFHDSSSLKKKSTVIKENLLKPTLVKFETTETDMPVEFPRMVGRKAASFLFLLLEEAGQMDEPLPAAGGGCSV